MTKIKICGLRRQEDIEAVNEAIPDYIGFVFAPSPRQVTFGQAEALRASLKEGIQVVGVFVNQPPVDIAALCSAGVIDLVQLHGDEDRAYIEALRALTDRPIIKAVRPQNEAEALAAQALPSDFLLYDTYTKDAYGGTGRTFAWELVKKVKRPFFLAGGLNAQNVSGAIAACRPYGVDISGGVETDGWKDRGKIVETVRRIRNEQG